MAASMTTSPILGVALADEALRKALTFPEPREHFDTPAVRRPG